MIPGRGALRLLRATSFAGSAVALAALAHAAGGGRVAGLPGLLVLTLFLAVPAQLLAGRRRRLRTVLPALAGSQLLLHSALAVVTGQATTGHAAGHGLVAAAAPGIGSVAAEPMPGMAGGLPKLAAHALAVLLTALLLTRAETALWELARLLLPRLPLPARRPGLAPAPAPVAGPRTVHPPAKTRPGAIRRRGPPAEACAPA